MLHKRRKKDKCPRKDNYTSTLPSLTFINNLLHSKSTYFYKRWEEKKNSNNTIMYKHALLSSSYLVPSVCILALLIGLYASINPNSISSITKLANYNVEKVYADITPSTSGGSGSSSSAASLTITPETTGSIEASVGETAYSNNIVQLAGENVKSYVLSISYTNDSSALVNNNTNTEDGATNSIITGANNTTGSNMAENTWGYGWSDSKAIDSSTLTYKTVPVASNPATIKSGAEGTIPNNVLAVEGELAFAVKFGEKAVSGHYTAGVLLSLAVQPAEVVKIFDGITTMQAMTSTICANAKENDTAQLTDTRDGKVYWVTKLRDGNCWMTQNLDYDDPSSARVSVLNNYNSTDATYRAYYDPGMTTMDNTGTLVDIGTHDTHLLVGNYYSYQSATNGTAPDSTGEATGSICPTGWRLPVYGSDGEYGVLLKGLTIEAAFQAPYYFFYSGGIGEGSTFNNNSASWYWTANTSGSSNAQAMNFSSKMNSISFSYTRSRYQGFPIRCLFRN